MRNPFRLTAEEKEAANAKRSARKAARDAATQRYRDKMAAIHEQEASNKAARAAAYTDVREQFHEDMAANNRELRDKLAAIDERARLTKAGDSGQTSE